MGSNNTGTQHWFLLFCDFFKTFYLWKMMQIYLQKLISKKNFFCWCLQGHWRKQQDPDPDPLVRSMDPLQNFKDPEHWFLQYPFSHLQPVHFWGERTVPTAPLILTPQQQVTPAPLGRVVGGVVLQVVRGRSECLRQPAHRLRRARHVLRRRDGGHLSQVGKNPGFFFVEKPRFSWVFVCFFVVFWFFWGVFGFFYLCICPEERVFRFFSVFQDYF